jgi:hypothetical protein
LRTRLNCGGDSKGRSPISSIGLILAVSVALAVLEVAPRAGATPPEIEQFLLHVAKFSQADISALENGTVIAKVESGGADTEVVTVAAVKVSAATEQVARYYGQMITYVDGAITKAFGKFSTPPAPTDVKDLSLDQDDIDQLKACKRGNCDIRIGGTNLDTARSSVTWNAPDSASQVNALVRRAVIEYVGAYMKSGDAALMTYNDRSEPVSLKQQWQGILAGSPYFQQYSPALREYLEQYPRKPLQGATDLLYWVKEHYTGLKPVISIVHSVIYLPPEHPERIVVVQKQLYASHYYDGSLAVANVIGTPQGTPPATYLIYGNRSRGDLLKGGFGGLRRKIARDQAKKSAEQTLGTIKSVLEQAAPAAR